MGQFVIRPETETADTAGITLFSSDCENSKQCQELSSERTQYADLKENHGFPVKIWNLVKREKIKGKNF